MQEKKFKYVCWVIETASTSLYQVWSHFIYFVRGFKLFSFFLAFILTLLSTIDINFCPVCLFNCQIKLSVHIWYWKRMSLTTYTDTPTGFVFFLFFLAGGGVRGIVKKQRVFSVSKASNPDVHRRETALSCYSWNLVENAVTYVVKTAQKVCSMQEDFMTLSIDDIPPC